MNQKLAFGGSAVWFHLRFTKNHAPYPGGQTVYPTNITGAPTKLQPMEVTWSTFESPQKCNLLLGSKATRPRWGMVTPGLSWIPCVPPVAFREGVQGISGDLKVLSDDLISPKEKPSLLSWVLHPAINLDQASVPSSTSSRPSHCHVHDSHRCMSVWASCMFTAQIWVYTIRVYTLRQSNVASDLSFCAFPIRTSTHDFSLSRCIPRGHIT